MEAPANMLQRIRLQPDGQQQRGTTAMNGDPKDRTVMKDSLSRCSHHQPLAWTLP
jgi:hypothetical protein